ncbi:MAG: hypothetical protein FWD57_03645 [Polyangiaceae bacterium]|nr:hypothetical protein [Polyangiaceae bacterium]
MASANLLGAPVSINLTSRIVFIIHVIACGCTVVQPADPSNDATSASNGSGSGNKGTADSSLALSKDKSANPPTTSEDRSDRDHGNRDEDRGRRGRGSRDSDTSGLPDGSACSNPGECASRICEGRGCGSKQGQCVGSTRPCTRDMSLFCGCDGYEFRASSQCPGRVYANRGPCRY